MFGRPSMRNAAAAEEAVINAHQTSSSAAEAHRKVAALNTKFTLDEVRHGIEALEADGEDTGYWGR